MKMIHIQAVLALIVASFILLLSLVEVQSETPRRTTTSIPSHLKGNGNAIEDWMLSRTQEQPRSGITLLSEPRVETGTVTNVLPASLPIGSEQQVNDWIVTNMAVHSRFVRFHLVYVDASNRLQEWWFTRSGQNYRSYEDYRESFVTNSMYLLKAIRTDKDYPASTNLWFFSSVGYYAFRGEITPYSGMKFSKKIGILSDITEDTFRKLEPSERLVIVPIPGLETFKVDVDYTFHYTNTWSITNLWKFQSPFVHEEWTLSRLLILNEWYSLGKYKSRFTVSAFGQTETYSEFGERLGQQVRLELNSKATHLTIYKPEGSDVTIQSSPDNINWSYVMDIMNHVTNTVTIPIIPEGRSRYYRAYSY